MAELCVEEPVIKGAEFSIYGVNDLTKIHYYNILTTVNIFPAEAEYTTLKNVLLDADHYRECFQKDTLGCIVTTGLPWIPTL